MSQLEFVGPALTEVRKFGVTHEPLPTIGAKLNAFGWCEWVSIKSFSDGTVEHACKNGGSSGFLT